MKRISISCLLMVLNFCAVLHAASFTFYVKNASTEKIYWGSGYLNNHTTVNFPNGQNILTTSMHEFFEYARLTNARGPVDAGINLDNEYASYICSMSIGITSDANYEIRVFPLHPSYACFVDHIGINSAYVVITKNNRIEKSK